MRQFELAQALGITPGMVSRLAKRGMPTDSVERAQRWRKRHLEPGRIKGTRFNPEAKPTQPLGVKRGDLDRLARVVSELETLCQLGEPVGPGQLDELRDVLGRCVDCGEVPALPLALWLLLVDYALEECSPLREMNPQGIICTPTEFGKLVRTDGRCGDLWLAVACDDPKKYMQT